MPTLPRFLTITVAIGALTALTGCAGVAGGAGSGPPAEAPAYRVGDRWVYHGDDGFRVKTEWDETHEVIAIGPEGITVRITLKGPTTDVMRNELWSAPGQVKVGAIYDNTTRRFAVPLERYDFPLASGKVWNQWVDNYNEFTKETGRINRWVRVGGWEKVATPAGTFDAVSMQVVDALGRRDVLALCNDVQLCGVVCAGGARRRARGTPRAIRGERRRPRRRRSDAHTVRLAAARLVHARPLAARCKHVSPRLRRCIVSNDRSTRGVAPKEA